MSNVYLLEAKMEFLKSIRLRQYSLSTILFPCMFYVFFGLTMGRESPGKDLMPMARYLLATYGAFGVIGATLFAFGAGLAIERGLGWLQVKRASPMPPAAYFVAKAAVAVAFGAAVVTLLFTMGALFGGVRMPLWQWLAMGGTLVAGSIPFCALGLVIGNLTGPNSAPAIVNMIYLPLSFCGGLWIPFDFLPPAIRSIAPFLPTFHFSQIALAILGAPVQGTIAAHIGALAAFTCTFAGAAWIAHLRGREKMFG
jgi:ABC-2 type transport system permease protein